MVDRTRPMGISLNQRDYAARDIQRPNNPRPVARGWNVRRAVCLSVARVRGRFCLRGNVKIARANKTNADKFWNGRSKSKIAPLFHLRFVRSKPLFLAKFVTTYSAQRQFRRRRSKHSKTVFLADPLIPAQKYP